MKLKYIIVHEPEEGKYSAILFPERLVHRDVANIHRAGRRNVISAAFVQIDYDQGVGNPPTVCVYGESESLGMGPNMLDAEIIKKDFT